MKSIKKPWKSPKILSKSSIKKTLSGRAGSTDMMTQS